MNVASLENCKELYEVSGGPGGDFFDTFAKYYMVDGALSIQPSIKVGEDFGGHQMVLEAPAYDLGYLLRKLPNLSNITGGAMGWTASYVVPNSKGRIIDCEADTPEDAACKLAIELFKQGVLK